MKTYFSFLNAKMMQVVEKKITAIHNRKQEINYTTKYDTIHAAVFQPTFLDWTEWPDNGPKL